VSGDFLGMGMAISLGVGSVSSKKFNEGWVRRGKSYKNPQNSLQFFNERHLGLLLLGIIQKYSSS